MADKDVKSDAKDFHENVPVSSNKFFLKGAHSLDWGMQNRLARIFNPRSARTVMLAFDHGYFMGPTSGLERMDLSIVPLAEHVDALMCTRGALRTTIPASTSRPVVLRCSAGVSILKELSEELIGVDIEDAIRINASAITCQVFIGGPYEHQTIGNLVKLIDTGNRHGIPTLAVTAVGKELVRDSRYLGLATRICAELGAHFVKTYFCEEGFEKVVAGCPIPVVIAGGKKLPEMDALDMAYKAIDQGAAGVDMGRNIFLSDSPLGMVKAVRGIVHDGLKVKEAYELYQTIKNER
ncbi:MAG: 3-hydroxy-5-phosphonooxypentane-2,4-dione thiolase [Planctomycetaceae bacterium]|nr:3-hydroxy-5-phosphonooxypentane-2,4-dione thiolase [Planctomycetaceae bacterium]